MRRVTTTTRLATTRRRTCRWSICRVCGGEGCRDYSAAAWDRYFALEVELAEVEEQVYKAFKAGKATSEDVTAALEQLAAHLQTPPGLECGTCQGIGSVRYRRNRWTRRRP